MISSVSTDDCFHWQCEASYFGCFVGTNSRDILIKICDTWVSLKYPCFCLRDNITVSVTCISKMLESALNPPLELKERLSYEQGLLFNPLLLSSQWVPSDITWSRHLFSLLQNSAKKKVWIKLSNYKKDLWFVVALKSLLFMVLVLGFLFHFIEEFFVWNSIDFY